MRGDDMENENGHLTVTPLLRSCQGCYLMHKERGCQVATWCASLCRDEEGQTWVSSRPLLGNGDGQAVKVLRSELSKPPKVLQ